MENEHSQDDISGEYRYRGRKVPYHAWRDKDGKTIQPVDEKITYVFAVAGSSKLLYWNPKTERWNIDVKIDEYHGDGDEGEGKSSFFKGYVLKASLDITEHFDKNTQHFGGLTSELQLPWRTLVNSIIDEYHPINPSDPPIVNGAPCIDLASFCHCGSCERIRLS
eukprot:SAG11_NODE_9525_length_903_cov_1.150498_1_plen_165_part_00